LTLETNALIALVLDVTMALFLIYAVYVVYQKKGKLTTAPKPQTVTVEPPRPEPAPPTPEAKPAAAKVEEPMPEPVKAEEPKPSVASIAPKAEAAKAPEKAAKPKPAKVSEKERGFPVIEIEGIGKKYTGKLHEAGIYYTAELLKVGATPVGRRELAEKTGISQDLVLEWVNLSDLFRIKGIGEEYSDLLEEAGVDTVVELSRRNAANLHAKIIEVNEAKKLVRRPPTLANIEGWIAEAKKLPRVIEY